MDKGWMLEWTNTVDARWNVIRQMEWIGVFRAVLMQVFTFVIITASPRFAPQTNIQPSNKKNKTTMAIAGLADYLRHDRDWSSGSLRQRALLADFSSAKRTNPDAYRANSQFWRQAILAGADSGWFSAAHTSKECNVLAVTADSIKLAIAEATGGRLPLSIDDVIGDMIEAGDLADYSSYASGRWSKPKPGTAFGARQEEAWGSWAFQKLVHDPLLWSLQQLSLVEEDIGGSSSTSTASRTTATKLTSDKLVAPAAVKRVGDAIVKHFYDNVQHETVAGILSLDSFRTVFASTLPANQRSILDSDADALLAYLEHYSEPPQIVTRNGDTKLIKFIARGSSSSNNKSATMITDIDAGIAQILRTQQTVHKQVTSLQARIASLLDSAQNAVSRKQRTVALSYLQQKKQIESQILPSRLKMQMTLDSIVLKLQETEITIAATESYRSGADAIKALLDAAKLTPDKVHEAMDELEDAMEQQKLVDDAMREGEQRIQASTDAEIDVSEAELEAELDKLLSEDTAKEDVLETVKVPNKQPPVSEPSVISTTVEDENEKEGEKEEESRVKVAN
ncbi:hypothetical protein GQ42DRAFT_180990 [Ramicandelaber brevisporus]|nr:hypothetical protein GQ42DRAFT_180990 [Ramicandelaber brevisporus]